MRVIDPVEDAPLRICVGPALATPARVAQLASLLRDAAAKQPREAPKARARQKPTKPAKPSHSNLRTVHTMCCCPHQYSNDDADDQEEAQQSTSLSAAFAVGRAVKVKLDDGKWCARLFCAAELSLCAAKFMLLRCPSDCRHKGRIARRGAHGDESVAIELDASKRKDLMRDWRTDDPEMELLALEPGAICPMPLDSTANKIDTERHAYGNFCCDYERIARELGRDTSSVSLRELWSVLPGERKAAYLRKAASDVSRQAQMSTRVLGVPALLRTALKQSQLRLVPQAGVWLHQDAASDIDMNEFYSRINAATDRIHAALEAGSWVYLHGERKEDSDDSSGEAWARACVAAYLVRYRDQQPAEALRRAFEGLGSSKARAGLENKLRVYAPILFSVALFKVGATTSDGEDSNRWFTYYASSSVGFIRNKLKTFPGCDFIFHINEEVGDEVGLLHSMYREAHGRITFHEYRFTPRKRIAPWLIAAMRLAPLLDYRWRLVVSADIHDHRDLQNSQLAQMIAKLRRKRKEMLITYWVAEDSNDDCMVSSPLPVGKNLSQVLSKSGDNLGVKASELHTHTDAGLLVLRGARCRDAISQSHDGLSFISHLSNLVRGAKTIPHGIEEMAFDLYLFEADWVKLLPFVHFDVHVNVMMGAEDGNV
eukprot:COSAG02_NODE_9772_length_2115_cov_1.286706_1_plen_654_part_01